MHIKLPLLAVVLIAVGLVLGGAAYMRFTLDPLAGAPAQTGYEGLEGEPSEDRDEAEESGEAETPVPSMPSAPAPSAPAEPKEAEPAGYTMADVRLHASAASCWTAIQGNVYDLTSWISRHPGGKSAITRLCGTDGTDDFLDQHGGDRSAISRLESFLLGPLQ